MVPNCQATGGYPAGAYFGRGQSDGPSYNPLSPIAEQNSQVAGAHGAVAVKVSRAIFGIGTRAPAAEQVGQVGRVYVAVAVEIAWAGRVIGRAFDNQRLHRTFAGRLPFVTLKVRG